LPSCQLKYATLSAEFVEIFIKNFLLQLARVMQDMFNDILSFYSFGVLLAGWCKISCSVDFQKSLLLGSDIVWTNSGKICSLTEIRSSHGSV